VHPVVDGFRHQLGAREAKRQLLRADWRKVAAVARHRQGAGDARRRGE
jgi:hypothetical protein